MADSIRHNFGDIIRNMLKKADDYSQPLTDWYGYMIRQTELTFRKLGRKGNTTPFRGVLWKWFAIQYVRKTGLNRIVLAEGIPGEVKGRLRHSRTRVTVQSMVMQDRGMLKSSALSRFRIGKRYLIASSPLKYADAQQRLRPYTFITDKDNLKLRDLVIKHLVS